MTGAIPVPEPGLTQEQIVQRAEDMIPTLRARQEETEQLGRLTDQTSRDFIPTAEQGAHTDWLCHPRRSPH